MFEILMHNRILEDGTEMTTFSRDVISHNILEVEAGTQGHLNIGSHGGKTYIRIKDQGCTNMEANVKTDGFGRTSEVELILEGFAELETIIKALKFITTVLEHESQEVHD